MSALRFQFTIWSLMKLVALAAALVFVVGEPRQPVAEVVVLTCALLLVISDSTRHGAPAVRGCLFACGLAFFVYAYSYLTRGSFQPAGIFLGLIVAAVPNSAVRGLYVRIARILTATVGLFSQPPLTDESCGPLAWKGVTDDVKP
jgi:hypothetical protein